MWPLAVEISGDCGNLELASMNFSLICFLKYYSNCSFKAHLNSLKGIFKLSPVKHNVHFETIIFWKFQIEGWHLGCLILTIVKGKWIIFKGELAEAPQVRPRAGVYLGNSLVWRRKSDFCRQDFYFEKNIFWKFQIDTWHLGCFILAIVKGKWFLFKGK